MRETGRNTAHKIYTQPPCSTRGMFPTHFTIYARPDGAMLTAHSSSPCGREDQKPAGGTGPDLRHTRAPARLANFYLVRN